MPADREDLARRVARTRPGDTVRGFCFRAVLHLVERHAGPDAAQALQAQHLPQGLYDFFNYPARSYLALIWDTADLLEPQLGEAQAVFHACGSTGVEFFFASALGKTLLRIVGRRDPKRLFSMSPAAFPFVASYGITQYEPHGEREVQLRFRQNFQPVGIHRGVVEGVLAATNCIGSVSVEERELDSYHCTVSWS